MRAMALIEARLSDLLEQEAAGGAPARLIEPCDWARSAAASGCGHC
jgi:hypothetical protein